MKPTAATPSDFILSPNVFSAPSPDISVSFCHEHELENHLSEFFDTITDGTIGLAPFYVGRKCSLTQLAIASRTRVLVISLRYKKGKASESTSDSPTESVRALLAYPNILKCAFQMDNLAASLFLSFGTRITNAKDLLSLARGSRYSFLFFMTALGGEPDLNKRVVKELHLSEGLSNISYKTLALQAWAAFSSSTSLSTSIQLEILPSIDTQGMDKKVVVPSLNIFWSVRVAYTLIIGTEAHCHHYS